LSTTCPRRQGGLRTWYTKPPSRSRHLQHSPVCGVDTWYSYHPAGGARRESLRSLPWDQSLLCSRTRLGGLGVDGASSFNVLVYQPHSPCRIQCPPAAPVTSIAWPSSADVPAVARTSCSLSQLNTLVWSGMSCLDLFTSTTPDTARRIACGMPPVCQSHVERDDGVEAMLPPADTVLLPALRGLSVPSVFFHPVLDPDGRPRFLSGVSEFGSHRETSARRHGRQLWRQRGRPTQELAPRHMFPEVSRNHLAICHYDTPPVRVWEPSLEYGSWSM